MRIALDGALPFTEDLLMSELVDIVPGQLYILTGRGEDWPAFINWTEQCYDTLLFVTSFDSWSDTLMGSHIGSSFKSRYILRCIDSTGEERSLPLFRIGSDLHKRFRHV